MSIIQNLISELREKRLWPVAAALVVALIAVPVLLSHGSKPLLPTPGSLAGSATVPALPAVNVTTTPSNARITGPERNPFTQQVKQSSGASTSKSSSGSSTTPGSSTSTTSTTSTTSSGSTGSSGSSTGGGTTTTTTTPAPALAPTSLTATQSYHVTISITNAAGGVNTVDPVERLSVLPSNQQPLLIELGVLQGGQRVMFLVQPGAVVRGAGTCTPGPIDCEVVSLAPNQIEGLFKSTGNGVSPVAQLAVTAIKTDRHSSRAAADSARLTQSAFGRRLLDRSTLSALSLFAYKPGIGAVADLRNLTVGGS